MGLSNFFDNFMGGLAFGMMVNNPFFGCMNSSGFGGGGFCSYPMMFTGYQNSTFEPLFDTTFQNSYPTNIDFSGVCQSIWNSATDMNTEYNRMMREMYTSSEKNNGNIPLQVGPNLSNFQFSMPFSSFYSPMTNYSYLTQTSQKADTNSIQAKSDDIEPDDTDSESVSVSQPISSNITRDKYFQTMLSFVLEHEGGYVNHPNDKGGSTNKGVTQTTYNNYRKGKGLSTRSVKNITLEEATEIYYQNYKTCGADKITNPRLAMCVFDWANHSGPQNAAMQKALKECNGDVNKFIKLRSNYLHNIIEKDPTQEVFRKGWDNRISDLGSFVSDKLPAKYA